MDAALVSSLYYFLVFIAFSTKLQDFFKKDSIHKENFIRARRKFLLGFFSYTIFDQIIIPYTQVSYKIYGFSRNQISDLQMTNQIMSIIGSLAVAFLMHYFKHSVLISFICILRAFACFLMISHSFNSVFVSTIFNGFSIMFAKICFDDWVIDIYSQYDLDQNEIAGIVNSRSTTQFILDIVVSSVVSYGFTKFGLNIVIYFSIVGFLVASFIPHFVMQQKNFPPIIEKSKPEKTEEKGDQNKKDEKANAKSNDEEEKKSILRPLLENPTVLLYFIVDVSYCFLSNIIKVFITVPYKSKSLPFSQILASYNCCILIGSSSSLFITKFISIKTSIHIALWIFMIGSLLVFFTYHIEIYAHFSTMLFGFGDGFFMPLTNCQRKEIYPTESRPFLLAAQRLLGSLIATQAVRFIGKRSDNYLGLTLFTTFSIAYISYLIMLYIKRRAKKMD